MSATRRFPNRARPRPPASPEELARFRRELRAVTRRYAARKEAFDEAESDRDQLVREAHAAGVTPSQIAAMTGLTTARIDQIRRGSRR